MLHKFFTMTVVGVAATLAATAHAHVTLEDAAAPAGSYYKAVFRVPHGCSGAATTRVAIKVPDGFIAVKAQPKPGWSLTTTTGAYGEAYDLHGASVAEGVQAVTWSGGELPDDQFDEFAIMGYLVPGLNAGSVLYFPIVQGCGDSVERWIELPEAGSDGKGLSRPAPALQLMDGTRREHGH